MNHILTEVSLSVLLGLVAGTPAAAGKFSVAGSLSGLPDSVKVQLIDLEDPNGNFERYAETVSKNGSFELSADFKSPRMTELVFFKAKPGSDKFYRTLAVRMMADGSSALTVSSPLSFDSLCNTSCADHEIEVSGSHLCDELREFKEATKSAQRHSDAIGFLSASKYFESNADRDTVMKYNAMKAVADEALFDARMNFIKAHPEYNISAYETQKNLEQIFRFTEPEIDGMADLVKVCPDTARINTVEKRRNFIKNYALGMKCPVFEATTPEGSVKNFSEYIEPGKYTFIDFWASWCGPCRAAIPHVKELAAKYAGKLNVVSVSVDENENAWRKAMEKEAMAWPQLHLAGTGQMGKGAKAFFITTIPRLIVLDTEGRVVCSTNSPDEVSSLLEKHL